MERGPATAIERAEPSELPVVPPPPPARQRWRLVLARDAALADLGGRELSDAFERAVEATGLPMVRPAGRDRGRVAFGAPLPLGIGADRELADILLTELLPVATVRDRIGAGLPEGWQLVEVYDVWLGAPPLAGQVAAADYRIELGAADAPELTGACSTLVAARSLPRQRAKGGTLVDYDLRPLLVDVKVIGSGPPVQIRARTRFDPVRGTGRPEEVVAALGDRLGRTLEVGSVVRERLLLVDELD